MTEPMDGSSSEQWAGVGSRAIAAVAPLEFRRSPLLAAAIWFACGEVLARHWQPTIILLAALGLLAGLTALALRQSLRLAIVPLAGVWVLVGMWSAEVQPAPSQQTALLRYADGLSRTVHGNVARIRMLPPRTVSAPQDQESEAAQWGDPVGPTAMSIDVSVSEIEEVTPEVSRMVPMEGGVRVTLIVQGGPLPTLRCGDLIEAPMQLRTPERYRDPGAWQYADYLLEHGIGVHATVRATKLARLNEGRPGLQCRIFAVQSWAAERLDRYLHSAANVRLPRLLRLNMDDGGMLKAMLFGDRTGLSQTQRMGFQRTGSFHLFVVSGLHVTLLAGAAFWITRRLRLREWLATLLTLGLASAYAVLTGFGAPVQRALWMTAIFLVARLLTRERNALNGLGAAALGVLVWSPASLFDSSFQMTFLAVAAIAGIVVPLGERSFLPYAQATRKLRDDWLDRAMAPRVSQFRVMLRVWGEACANAAGSWAFSVPTAMARWALWAAELALLGFVVEMVMVLPMAVYFHRATPFALPANMLSVPMVAVLAPLGVLTFAASLVSNWVALPPGAVTALLVHSVRASVGMMSRAHISDVRVPAPAAWVMVVAVATWAFCCWAVRKRSAVWMWIAVAVLPLIAVMVLWPEPAVVSTGVMEVTALDVGQGDSLLVVSPAGQAMLVDAGGPVGGVKEAAEAQAAFDMGEEIVSPYLWSRRIRRLDVIALSHAHSDHMGGMASVMRNFRPRELWVGVDAQSEAYRALLAEAAELGVTVRHLHTGDALSWSDVGIKVLSPAANYINPGDPKNDDSLVLQLQFDKAAALLEGDAETPSERAMLASGRLGPVTLLKVGHHGSRTSTTPEFFAAVQPHDAVVSVGRHNTFGHPRPEVIDRILAAHTHLYRTDQLGLTTFLLDRDGGVREIVGASHDSGGW